MLAVKQDHIDDREDLVHISIADATLSIEADMYPLFLELATQRNERLRLYGGLSSTEGNPPTLPKERALTNSSSQDLSLLNELPALPNRDGIGIGTIEALEVASLEEYH